MPISNATISHTNAHRAARHARRGFSLLEIIVVVAILGVLVAFIAPRLTTLRRSEGQLATDQVADMMRMWAYRNSMMTQQVGIWCDPGRNELRLMIRDIDPRYPDAGPVWQEDRLTLPFSLPENVTLVDVYIDGVPQPPEDWFVQSNADGSRPRFEVGVINGSTVTRLLVEPYSTSVARSDDGAGGASRQRIDLDQEGGRDMRW